MIEETGIVKKVAGTDVWIETQIKTTCGSCQVSKNCGTSVVAKAFTAKPELLKLSTPHLLKVGQSVKLGIPEEQLIGASSLVYLLPIFVLVISVTSFQYLLPSLHEMWQILFGFAATALSFWQISKYAKRQDKGQFSPVILGAINDSTVTMKNEIPLKKVH
ncbi:SoxR reducing system RseC family protein [Glaciecola sp. MF2-115]|uniref:SoxR reducing system RseC family protein n=1 Tax=Glaciecola sp. MF2-115 TaxID=3384827 RepID=UPI00399FF759